MRCSEQLSRLGCVLGGLVRTGESQTAPEGIRKLLRYCFSTALVWLIQHQSVNPSSLINSLNPTPTSPLHPHLGSQKLFKIWQARVRYRETDQYGEGPVEETGLEETCSWKT